ncbi:MAG: hypothetical protein JJE34_01275 [Alphaproteobacteria bacterium]|nr:hypothetical protein [Alphaproteobacteria bacterium]
MTDIIIEILPLQRLLIAYAPKNMREGQQILWAFDARMAEIVRSTQEPMIGQIRFAWWREALSGEKEASGVGDPLMDALRARVLPDAGAAGLLEAIEGWEVLLEPLPLSDRQLVRFAEHRGGGLFRTMGQLAGLCPPWLSQAGMGWALWDLSGHVSDGDTAMRSIAMAQECLADVPVRGWPDVLAPLQMLVGLVRRDVRGNRTAPARMSWRQYGHLLWLGLWRKGKA